jgi:excisionase family DNA binding protein
MAYKPKNPRRKRAPRPPVQIHPEAALVSIEQAATIAGVGRAHGYELVKAGIIPTVRLGRKLRVNRAELLDLIRRNRLTTEPVARAAR